MSKAKTTTRKTTPKPTAAAPLKGIAIIGMACRVPGAMNYREFWRNLCNGVESVTVFSDEELIAAGISPAEIAEPDYVKTAFRIPGIDKFDAAFFEYSPREARLMDPQHRFLLEVGWEAFEDAGYIPGRHLGPVGIVLGTGGNVSSYMVNELYDHPESRGRTANLVHIGNDKDFASTRLSFKFDLTGPSLNVQTACSTSLIAVHLACQSIQTGECTMALAGGATVRVPEISGYRSVRGGLYSPDGHVRTFDADARGTVFGSAVGMVLLKEVNQAVADGDTIYAVIKSTAVNNDGGTKASYSGSSVPGQAGAMIKALELAEVTPDTIGYAECHGTGTAVGDPIEIAALTETFKNMPVPAGSCPVGSVKPNIGHPEQAAGIVSLIKTALALHEQAIPPTINIRTLNPKINFTTSPFYVNQELKPWPKGEKVRRALVNSLGIGGTNGVVILEEAPTQVPVAQTVPERPAHLVVLSAKSEAALKDALVRQAEVLEETPGASLPDVAYSLAQGRVAFSHRYTAVAGSVDELIEKLRTAEVATAADRRAGAKRKIGFLFTGQGAQFAGMGKALYDSQPLFRATFDRCAAAMVGILPRPLAEAVFADPNGPDAGLINRTEFTQPGTFALQVSLATLLQSWGITPQAMAGHSVGEFALSVVAGVYSLEAAATLIATRGKLMQALPEGGTMAAVFTDEASVRAALAELNLPQIGVAAVNGPANTVVSGLKTSVDVLIAYFEPKGITARPLTVSHAFHSVLMDPAMADFRTALAAAKAEKPGVTWVSTLTGAVKADAPSADYWVSHAMDAVRFADAVKQLQAEGVTDFIEIGPGKSMLALAQSSIAGDSLAFLPTVAKDGSDGRDLLETVGALFRRGEAIDWKGFDAPWTRRRVALPTYPFQGERMWNERDGAAIIPGTATAQAAATANGLVGTRLRSSLPEAQFETVYSQKALPWIKDHKVYSHVVLPTTAGLVGLLQAGAKLSGDKPLQIANFSYRAPLFLGEADAKIVHLVLKPGEFGSFDASLSSAEDSDAFRWQTHISAALRPAPDATSAPTFVPEAVISRTKPLPVDRYYSALTSLGLDYGPAFRGIQSMWQGLGEVLAHVRLADGVAADGFPLHPALLDATLHTYPAVIDAFGDFSKVALPPEGLHLPAGIERFSLLKSGEKDVWVHLRKRLQDVSADPASAALVVDIDVYAMDGSPVAKFEGLSLRPIPVNAFQPKGAEAGVDWLYQVRWDKLAAGAKPQVAAPNAWVIFADDAGVGAALAKTFETRNHPVKLIAKSALIPAGAVKVDGRDSFAPVLTQAAQDWADKRVGIVYLWGLDTSFGDGKDLEAQQAAVIGNALHLTQALADARDGFKHAPALWLGTRNGLDIRDGSKGSLDLAQAGLWGFGRTVSLEYPQTWGGLIDLAPGGINPAETQALANHLLAGDREAQVAFRLAGGQLARYGARFVRAKVTETRAATVQDATYLITGGLGAIGIETAKYLITHRGIRHLVLASRRGGDDPTAAGIKAELEALGARISVEKLDTSSEASVTALIKKLRSDALPLKGIYHSAGVLEDATIAQFAWDKFRKAIAPKFDGAWFLHKATEDLQLDDFVVYSSILSLFGAGGQANYTSGNAYLDGLAALRRQQGKPGLAVNWGPWAAGGLATLAGDKGEAIWRARGLIYTKPEEGQDALKLIVEAGFNHAAVLSADWTTIIGQFQPVPRFFDAMLGEVKTDGAAASGGLSVEALQAQLKSSDPRDRRFAIVTYVAQQAQATLGVTRSIDPGQPLRELGLDSLMAVTLINRIEMALGVRVPAVKLIQGPSIDQLVDEVWPDLAGVGLPDAPRTVPGDAPTDAPAVPAAVEALVSDLISETVEAALAAPTIVEDAKWLIPVGKRSNPRARLFCFPFAGGGSAVFRPWANWIDPAIEVIAVEPPGRLGRISEKPVNDMDLFVDCVLDEMIDLLDLPFAMFGHCLGAVTMYETARTLIEETKFRPLHLFASGARAPNKVGEVGPFEQDLGKVLMQTQGYRHDLKPYEQSDEIFADIIRKFDMAATDQFLSDPELRKLMLPAVRAEFEMTSNYKLKGDPKPWDVPITCFVSRGDPYVSREDILAWGQFTNQRLQVLMREGSHYAVVEDAQFINRIINREMVMPL